MLKIKRLIDPDDVYSLFCENGIAKLHVGDIDTIKRIEAVPVVHGFNTYDHNSAF